MNTNDSGRQAGNVLAEELGLTVLGTEGHDLKCACIACASSDALRVHQDTGVAQCYSCNGKWSAWELCLASLGQNQEAAEGAMIAAGLFEPRRRPTVRTSPSPTAPSLPELAPIPTGQGANHEAITRLAAAKRVPPTALLAYGAYANGPFVFVPMYGPDGAECSRQEFDILTDATAKGKYTKGRHVGLFLPDSRRPQPGETWYAVEGWKDSAALYALGVRNVAGLPGNVVPKRLAPMFAGVTVVLVPDADLGGQQGAVKSAHILKGHAKAVFQVDLPAEFKDSDGDGVREVLARPGGRDELLQALEKATPVGTDGEPEEIERFEFLTTERFLRTEYRNSFLVKGVLVQDQPAIIGGPHKVLKTSVMLDLVVSLATGRPFLGEFRVPRPVRVMVFSGESGAATVQRVVSAIVGAKGIVSAYDMPVVWNFDTLPQIALDPHLAGLAASIKEHRVEAVVIDPSYLCLLAGAQGLQASNLFDMGPLLLRLSRVGQKTSSTIILVHHCRKNLIEPYKPPELVDLSMAGFCEWARQWLLIGRREPYEQGTGLHRLWLNMGGSAGHSGCYAVDVDEGVLDDFFGGHKWVVSVEEPEAAREDAKCRMRDRKAVARDKWNEQFRDRLANILASYPRGETGRALRVAAGLNPNNFGAALESLLKSGVVVPCSVQKNGREYDGFQLSDSQYSVGGKPF